MDAEHEVVKKTELLMRLYISDNTLRMWMRDLGLPRPVSNRWWWPNVVAWWERVQGDGE